MSNWADSFHTYSEACQFFGVDTPAQLASEAAWQDKIQREEATDQMESTGTTNPVFEYDWMPW